MKLQDSFNELVREQKALGYDENSGLQKKLRESGNAVERIINENVNWLTEFDAQRLMLSLLTMRHQEAEYRLSQSELSHQLFFAAKNQFTSLFDNIDGKAERKAPMAKQVEDYGDVFSQWITSFNQIDPLRKMIDLDTQDMLPRTESLPEPDLDPSAAESSLSSSADAEGTLPIGASLAESSALASGTSSLTAAGCVVPCSGGTS